jgi:hypothetical protein
MGGVEEDDNTKKIVIFLKTNLQGDYRGDDSEYD